MMNYNIPIALVGDTVSVRFGEAGAWEEGVVGEVSTLWRRSDDGVIIARFFYRVIYTRKSLTGQPITSLVGSSGISLIEVRK